MVAAGTEVSLLVCPDLRAGVDVDYLDFHVGKLASYARYSQFQRVVGAGLGDDGARLGLAVGYGDLLRPHHVDDLLHNLHRTGGAGHDACAQGTGIVVFEVRVIQLRYEHGRHAEESRTLLPIYGPQHRLRIEALDGDHRRLVGDGVECAKNAAKAMEEGNGYTHPVFRPELHALPDIEGVLDDVRVGQLHTLREARRPGGVLHVYDVFGVERVLPRAESIGEYGFSPLQELPEAHDRQIRRGFRTHEDEVLEEGQFLYRQLVTVAIAESGNGSLQNLQKIRLPDAFGQEQGCGIRLLQHVLQLVGFVGRIDGNENGPDLARRELQRHPLWH